MSQLRTQFAALLKDRRRTRTNLLLWIHKDIYLPIYYSMHSFIGFIQKTPVTLSPFLNPCHKRCSLSCWVRVLWMRMCNGPFNHKLQKTKCWQIAWGHVCEMLHTCYLKEPDTTLLSNVNSFAENALFCSWNFSCSIPSKSRFSLKLEQNPIYHLVMIK